jgi:hypothetical protein
MHTVVCSVTVAATESVSCPCCCIAAAVETCFMQTCSTVTKQTTVVWVAVAVNPVCLLLAVVVPPFVVHSNRAVVWTAG